MQLLSKLFLAFSKCKRTALGTALLAFTVLSAAQAQSTVDCPPEAQPPTEEQMQTGLDTARDRGFLWRIYKEGHTSYLYGTVHAAQLDWAYPGPQMMQVLRASDVVALEMDVLDPLTVQRMQAGMAAAPRRALPKALIQRMKMQMQVACLPESLLTTMSPEMLTTTLVMLSAKREGLEPAYGIDLVYASLARGLKKPISALETPERQLQLLHGRTNAETLKLVEQSLTELEGTELQPMMRRLMEDWAESRFDDIAQYETWCRCFNTAFDRTMQARMFDERNPDMARKIDALHTSGKSVFVAVGSLHMVGNIGLPYLLAQRGYVVERVVFAR